MSFAHSRTRVPTSTRGIARALGAFAVGYLAYHLAFEVPDARRHSVRPAFDRIAALRGEGAPRALRLVDPSDAIQGATVYYLGEIAPMATGTWRAEPTLARTGYLLLGEPGSVARIVADLPPPGAEIEHFDIAGRPYALATVLPSPP